VGDHNVVAADLSSEFLSVLALDTLFPLGA
jgi:hypothetical protein